MLNHHLPCPLALPGLLLSLSVAAQAAPTLPGLPPHSPRLQIALDAAVAATVQEFAGKSLGSNQLAATLIDLTAPEKAAHARYRGDVPIYPASVVKLFYLVAAHRWMEDGQLRDTPELRRALRDMIVESYNEATHYLVDLLTGTTSGPELPDEDLREWFNKRNAVNRYFALLGYTNINVNKKPWCEGPYGRESQAIQTLKPARNMLTTDATARLVMEIVTGKAVSPKRSAEMLTLMQRNLVTATKDPDDQSRFSGPALPAGAKLWSKAGWTSETRHDAAYLELPDGRKLVLVVFTVDHANERGIIHSLVRRVVQPQEP